MSRVFVVGSRELGAATGSALVRAGHRVTFVDGDEARVAALSAGGLDARPNLDLAGEPEGFVLLCGPTTAAGGAGYDLAGLADGAARVGRALAAADARHVVAVRSTVPPGTTGELVEPMIEQWSGAREGTGFALAACPDLDDRMTVVGARSRQVAHRLAELLGPAGAPARLFDDPATAELVKCTTSLFNATKISFWNEIWRVCDELGLDPDGVADAVAGAARGSTDPAYGLRGGAPYGGSQLPGDTGGFLAFAAELGIPMPVLSAVVGVNASFRARMDAELDGAGVLSSMSPPAAVRRREAEEPEPEQGAAGHDGSPPSTALRDAPPSPRLARYTERDGFTPRPGRGLPRIPRQARR